MYSKKDLLDSLEVINENLNTLIHNQMIIYSEIKKLLEAQAVEEKTINLLCAKNISFKCMARHTYFRYNI